MKKLRFPLTALCLLVAACDGPERQVQDFIDGTYVNHSRGAYGIADDTLTFTRTEGSHYLITRRTGYQAIREGKALPKKYRQEKLEGVYDAKEQLLHETLSGRIFRFDPKQGILLQKQAVYRKLNN